MKDSFKKTPYTDSGMRYWRSLDELADTPEFRSWVENEFPAGASELKDDVSRRDFMKLMSASFLLAGFGMTGCRRPLETIVPFVEKPENYVHGVPQFYATSMPERGGAIPLLARSNDGRPTKLEGNPDHPYSNGSTNVFAQAAILNLYDPDRATEFKRGRSRLKRQAALESLQGEATAWRAKRGNGVCILLEESTSPSRARLLELVQAVLPYAQIATYEPISHQAERDAATLLTGTTSEPVYSLEKAKVILSLDCDFLGSEKHQIRHIGDFAAGRKVNNPGDPMNRLYSVEGLMTLTGANADHRLRVPTGSVIRIAAQIASQILIQAGDSSSPLLAAFQSFGWVDGVNPQWVNECAKDLLESGENGLVMAGYRQPMEVHLIAFVINAALGSIGKGVRFREPVQPQYPGIESITQALNSGQVNTLVIVGGNPVYNAPLDHNWAEAIGFAKKVFRLGYYEDETSSKSDYIFPATHFLESWGDARSADGTVVSVQPLISPLFEGVSELEFLAIIAGEEDTSDHSIVRKTFTRFAGSGDFEEAWKRFLHRGFVPDSATAHYDFKVDHKAISDVLVQSNLKSLQTSELEVVLYRDYSVDDGRFANNGWLQELPDPITKITWDNAILVSRQTAQEYGLKNRQVIRVLAGGGVVEGPVWIQPGLADKTLALALGYGRDSGGRVAGGTHKKVGFNAYKVRNSLTPYIVSGAKIEPTEKTQVIACTQDHWSMEGRAIVREGNLSQYNEKPDFAQNMGLEAHTGHIPHDEDGEPLGIYKHPYVAQPSMKSEIHQWGMVVDLSSCVGCSACVIACQSENNIPIVGKNQVARSREMHWLRIDRYFSGDPDLKKGVSSTASDEAQTRQQWIDDPQMVNQPMMCQHCESAPCESVCPVNATVHDAEGLNVMVYNRCVGTRYCSNNCPYKVRRFNFFDYNKRPLDKLYQGPLAKLPKKELDLVELIKNPDVTVRMRGVMEKCTFCIQRIEQAKISQKIKAKASGDVEVPDGTIQTACEQACPADAIVFGNVADPNSRVSKIKTQQKNYSVLGFLDTRPRTTYLAKLRNPNPSMPDHYDMPLSLMEYTEKMGNPMEEHHAPGDAVHGDSHVEEKGAH